MKPPIPHLPVLLGSLALIASAPAQNQTIVSPAAAAATDGSASNQWPWLPSNSTPTSAVNIQRYMQIHSDLGSGVKVVKKLAFRRNGASATAAGSRAVDVEIWMGSSVDYDKCSWVYANNWIGAPTKVLSRQVVNIGPLATAGNPAPFEIAFPVGPYVHTGATSLAWDALIYGNVETPPLATQLDADASSGASSAAPAAIGTGCFATGQTSAMSLVVSHQDSGGTYVIGGYVDYAPTNAPLYLALGATNPNVTLPGLCSSIYTDFLVVLPLGLTDATGFFGVTGKTGTTVTKGPGGPLNFAVTNTFAGRTLYLQAHAIDAGSALAIPVASSNGRSAVVPTPNTTKITKVTRLFHTDGLPTGPWATSSPPPALSTKFEPLNVGYGVVTEFTY